MAKLKMPEPDDFGAYYFGAHNKPPVIFPHKQLRVDEHGGKHVESTGKFTALFEAGRFLEHDRGPMKGRRVLFDSADEALDALNEAEW